MIATKIQNEIIEKIRGVILSTFGENNIKSAFITGSIAAGKERPDSDVDIFICYSDSTESPLSRKQEFVSFYFDLHNQLSRTPDHTSPGELLSFSELSSSLQSIMYKEPSEILRNRGDFDAICWAGMLVSKRNMLINDDADIKELIVKSRNIVHKWARSLEPELALSEGTGEYTDIDKVLRRRISCPGYYDAH